MLRKRGMLTDSRNWEDEAKKVLEKLELEKSLDIFASEIDVELSSFSSEDSNVEISSSCSSSEEISQSKKRQKKTDE